MHQESGGQEDVISWAGAVGLMQVMPDTYEGLRQRYNLGDDPFDPHNNILAGTAYLREMYDRFGSPGFLAAYNAGPNRVDRYLNDGTPLPAETVNYVASIAPLLGPGTPMSGPLAVYAGTGQGTRSPLGRRRPAVIRMPRIIPTAPARRCGRRSSNRPSSSRPPRRHQRRYMPPRPTAIRTPPMIRPVRASPCPRRRSPKHQCPRRRWRPRRGLSSPESLPQRTPVRRSRVPGGSTAPSRDHGHACSLRVRTAAGTLGNPGRCLRQPVHGGGRRGKCAFCASRTAANRENRTPRDGAAGNPDRLPGATVRSVPFGGGRRLFAPQRPGHRLHHRPAVARFILTGPRGTSAARSSRFEVSRKASRTSRQGGYGPEPALGHVHHASPSWPGISRLSAHRPLGGRWPGRARP